MDIHKHDTKVVDDPQHKVSSESGVAWGLVGDGIKENKKVGNIERISQAAKRNGFDVFIVLFAVFALTGLALAHNRRRRCQAWVSTRPCPSRVRRRLSVSTGPSSAGPKAATDLAAGLQGDGDRERPQEPGVAVRAPQRGRGRC